MTFFLGQREYAHKEKRLLYWITISRQAQNNIETSPKKQRINRINKMSKNNKRKRLDICTQSGKKTKQQCKNIDVTHAYLSLNHGMVSYTADYIQYLKYLCFFTDLIYTSNI
jgi:hypothetical protein